MDNKNLHYLEKEILDLFGNNNMIFNFIDSDVLDGLWYWDLKDMTHEYLSPKFWKILGYDPKDKKHLASEWKYIINQNDLLIAIDNLNKHLEDPIKNKYDQIVRYTHKDNHIIYIRCFGKVLHNNTRMLGAHTDITKIIKLKEMQKMSFYDHLTNLLNRRGLHHKFKEHKKTVAKINTLSYCFLDIDFFKRINDNFGHDVGDKVLNKIGKILLSLLTTPDLVSRWGGEEFLIIIINKDTEILKICSEIKQVIYDTEIIKNHKITVSIGCYTGSYNEISDKEKQENNVFESFLKRADRALYKAKESGRNKVIFYN